MPMIALHQLQPDVRNANVCPSAIMDKIKGHIAQSGFCPALLVRPHPQQPGQYVIVDGHHRKLGRRGTARPMAADNAFNRSLQPPRRVKAIQLFAGRNQMKVSQMNE